MGPTKTPTRKIDRIRIICLWLNGEGAKDISQNVGTSVTTVYRWIRRWKLEGHVDRRIGVTEAKVLYPCRKESVSKNSMPSISRGELPMSPFSSPAVWLRPSHPYDPLSYRVVSRECPSNLLYYYDEVFKWVSDGR